LILSKVMINYEILGVLNWERPMTNTYSHSWRCFHLGFQAVYVTAPESESFFHKRWWVNFTHIVNPKKREKSFIATWVRCYLLVCIFLVITLWYFTVTKPWKTWPISFVDYRFETLVDFP
jgi:hypothetical protein